MKLRGVVFRFSFMEQHLISQIKLDIVSGTDFLPTVPANQHFFGHDAEDRPN